MLYPLSYEGRAVPVGRVYRVTRSGAASWGAVPVGDQAARLVS